MVIEAAPEQSGGDAVVESGTSITTALAEMPNDYYDYTADAMAQQVFFQAMILGVLLFMVFSGPFHR